MTLLQ